MNRTRSNGLNARGISLVEMLIAFVLTGIVTSSVLKAYVTQDDITTIQQYVDNSDTSHPNLMLKLPVKAPLVYAESISDVQFQYKLEDGSIVDVPVAVKDVREILITVTGRSSRPDPDLPNGQQYRTRTSTTSVALRNLGV